jgi:DNA-binding NtrC family response regulator
MGSRRISVEEGEAAIRPTGARFGSRQSEVLVVEDDESVRKMLGMALRHHGFGVRLAAGGAEAVELYQRHRATIGVVLLDVQMDVEDGPQTLAALRQLDPAVQCCFMSGNTGRYNAEELYSLGVAAVLQKPFRLEDLARVLEQVVRGG